MTVTGVPEPDVKWYRNDVEFQPTVKVKISSEEDGLHRLTVTSVTPTMTGDYKVIASNSAGQAEHLATVTINGKDRTVFSFVFTIITYELIFVPSPKMQYPFGIHKILTEKVFILVKQNLGIALIFPRGTNTN